jgi:hypothetical protein
MEKLNRKGTEDSPEVILDAENKVMEISGRSLPEDVATFYESVISWLEEYAKNPDQETVFTFRLDYFNTATSKVILDILVMFEQMIEEGHSVKVRWFYDKEDEDMQAAGEEYSDMVDVPFELISIG